MQQVDGGGFVAEQQRFRDLELEPAGIEARRIEGGPNVALEVAALELHHREVDGHAQVRRPGTCITACLLQSPSADRHDQAAFLCKWNELGWRDQSTLGMTPA